MSNTRHGSLRIAIRREAVVVTCAALSVVRRAFYWSTKETSGGEMHESTKLDKEETRGIEASSLLQDGW
jgi:hypothetical protein